MNGNGVAVHRAEREGVKMDRLVWSGVVGWAELPGVLRQRKGPSGPVPAIFLQHPPGQVMICRMTGAGGWAGLPGILRRQGQGPVGPVPAILKQHPLGQWLIPWTCTSACRDDPDG